MRYRKGIFQGLQARRAQTWILNKEIGPEEKTREGGKNMESQGSQREGTGIGLGRVEH